jgi:hypothetical protein
MLRKLIGYAAAWLGMAALSLVLGVFICLKEVQKLSPNSRLLTTLVGTPFGRDQD